MQIKEIIFLKIKFNTDKKNIFVWIEVYTLYVC